MDSGIKWPNDTTTPRSYILQTSLEIGQSKQSRFSELAYFFTGLDELLNDVTTARFLTVRLSFLLINRDGLLKSEPIKIINLLLADECLQTRQRKIVSSEEQHIDVLGWISLETSILNAMFIQVFQFSLVFEQWFKN